MNKITKAIKQLKAIVPIINKKYRSHAEQVIQLFSDRKIEKTKEAENLLIQLASRGLAPQSAIKKITEKYSKAESATGKLSRPTLKNIANKIKTFFVSGVIKSSATYTGIFKKTGEIKTKTYQLTDEPFAVLIKAKNQEEAEQKYHADAEAHYAITRPTEDSNINRSRKFEGADIIFDLRS